MGGGEGLRRFNFIDCVLSVQLLKAIRKHYVLVMNEDKCEVNEELEKQREKLREKPRGGEVIC